MSMSHRYRVMGATHCSMRAVYAYLELILAPVQVCSYELGWYLALLQDFVPRLIVNRVTRSFHAVPPANSAVFTGGSWGRARPIWPKKAELDR
jgi:hypothetical protein